MSFNLHGKYDDPNALSSQAYNSLLFLVHGQEFGCARALRGHNLVRWLGPEWEWLDPTGASGTLARSGAIDLRDRRRVRSLDETHDPALRVHEVQGEFAHRRLLADHD